MMLGDAPDEGFAHFYNWRGAEFPTDDGAPVVFVLFMFRPLRGPAFLPIVNDKVLLNSRSTLSSMCPIRAITSVPASEAVLRASLSMPHSLC